MKRNANFVLHHVTLTPDIAGVLKKTFNEENRKVNDDHVLNMALDYSSDTEYYMPDLVAMVFTIPAGANSGVWTNENLFEKLTTYRKLVKLVNGGHTSTLFANHEMTMPVTILVYVVDSDEDEASIRRSCDKSRARGGADKMHFSGSTTTGVYEATGVVFGDPELGYVHKAVSVIMKGFSLSDTTSPTSQFSVAATAETIKYAETARSYLNKIEVALTDKHISKKQAKELRSQGLMSIFVFLMQHERHSGQGYNFLNAVLAADEKLNSKKPAEQFFNWLLETNPTVNPTTNSKKTSAQLQAFAYYWNAYYEAGGGNSTVPNLTLASNFRFVTKGATVTFSGIPAYEIEKHEAYTTHADAKKELRARVKRVKKAQALLGNTPKGLFDEEFQG